MSIVVLKPGEDSWTYPSRFDDFDKTLPVIDRWYRRYSPTKRYCRYLYDRLGICLAEEIKRYREVKHYDCVIGVGGKEGKGKSHWSYYLAKLIDPDFTLKKGYIYDAYAFVEAINAGEDRGFIFWLDEATNVASNRDWMKEENKLFIQILEMCRAMNWVLIMDIPLLKRLDVYLRDFRLRYTVEIEELAWDVNRKHMDRGYWYLRKARDSNNGPMVKVGWGEFPPMPPEVEKDYVENYKLPAMKRKFKEIQQIFEKNRGEGENLRKKEGKANRAMIAALRESGMSYQEISELTGMTYNSLANSYSKYKKERMEND